MAKSLVSVEEVRRLFAQFAKECHDELLRQGKFGKGFRVDGREFRACIKRKFLEYKRSLAGRTA